MEEKKYWKDVNITVDMPLSAFVQFVNILNNRLSVIEDAVITKDEEGNDVSLSEMYARQNNADEEGAK